MKKISLFVVASSAALMTACTDYVSKIEDLHEERESLQALYDNMYNVDYSSLVFSSGCSCEVNRGNLIEVGGQLYYNTESNLPTITYALVGCTNMPDSVTRLTGYYENMFIESYNVYQKEGVWWADLQLNGSAQNALFGGTVSTYLSTYGDGKSMAGTVECPAVSFGYKAPEADEPQTSTTTNTTSSSTSGSTTQYGTFGTCAPNLSTVKQGEQVTWTFTYNTSSGLKAADILSASISWNLPGGSPSTYTGTASQRTVSTKYATTGTYAASATVTAGGVMQNVNCSRVTVKAASTSSANKACGDLWCGLTDTQGQVNTGYEGIEETSGYWYEYTDKDNNGTSAFIYPADVEENEYQNFFGPLIEAYGGLRGTVTLGDGYDYPFAGLAFNIVSQNEEGADISDWGGICVVYESTVGFVIELAVEDEARVTEYNNYKASVPKSATMTVADFPWAKFKQESGWGETVAQETALASVSTIRLKFSGGAGTSGDFLFQSLGRLGTCN